MPEGYIVLMPIPAGHCFCIQRFNSNEFFQIRHDARRMKNVS